MVAAAESRRAPATGTVSSISAPIGLTATARLPLPRDAARAWASG
jgi:hypothetical protein